MNSAKDFRLTPREVTQAAERAKAWITSKEGRKAVRETLDEARKFTTSLADARVVSREALHEPVTR